MNKVVLFGIVGGGVTVALIVLIIVLASMGGDAPVASTANTSPTTGGPITGGPPVGITPAPGVGISPGAGGPAAPPGITPGGVAGPGGPTAPGVVAGPVNPMATPSTGATAISPMPAAGAGATGAGATGEAAAGTTPANTPTLNMGVMRWYAKAGEGLRGARMVEKGDKDDEMIYQRFSWMVEILPFIGHEALHAKFRFDQPWNRDPNLQLSGELIPQFLNPSDPRPRWKGYPNNNVALTHYVGMSGIEDRRMVVAATLPRSDPRAGMFGYDAIAKPEEITDGLGQTIAVLGSGELTGPWVQGGGPTIRGAREPYFDDITGFGTKGMAPKGVMTMFADGSVRNISADIDPKVFRAMCTIHGAETVDLAPFELVPGGFPIGSTAEASPTEESKE